MTELRAIPVPPRRSAPSESELLPHVPFADSVSEVDRRTMMPRLSCVVPCFNEARNVELLLPVLQQVLSRLVDEWEVILVDDGSTDDTAAVLARCAQAPGFRAVLLSRNFGKEAALTAGMQAADGDIVVLMDADLQHPPQMIATMLERWREGADVVYAVHSQRNDEQAWKRFGARWT
jgi:glycosyltransferase involved in cell wall biosynthesis